VKPTQVAAVWAARGVRAALPALMETGLCGDPAFLLVLKIVHNAFQRGKKKKKSIVKLDMDWYMEA